MKSKSEIKNLGDTFDNNLTSKGQSLTGHGSSCNAVVSGSRGLRLKFRAGQIGHSAAKSLLPLRHFLERSCVAREQ